MIEQKHIEEAEKHPGLGPHYFSAREGVERFMASFAAEHFEPLLKKAADDFYERLLQSLHDHLAGDTETNLAATIRYGIDNSVEALLSGDKWAIERYALQKYNGEKIRAGLAALIPQELQDGRVKDLEAENKGLRESLERERRRYA